jgi:hypothetical protein
VADIPKAVWEGSFRIYGVEVKCYVLDDGRRIIDANSMWELLNSNNSESVGELKELHLWMQGDSH